MDRYVMQTSKYIYATNTHSHSQFASTLIHGLCAEETDKAMEHILENDSDLMANIVNYKAKTSPFNPFMLCLNK